MATSPNFSWPEPDNTDLVKNGALAIRTAINAIDTSMVDLKGGTTGQVLAKASATDMDFSWTTSSAGMTNPMTTTGDTIYSSSGSTPARLGIGSTGQVLTVSGGVPSWAAASSGAMTLISSTTLVSSTTSVTFSSISSAYTHLQVIYNVIGADDFIKMSFNNVTTNTYYSQQMNARGTSVGAYESLNVANMRCGVNQSNGGGWGTITIPNYKNTTIKKGITAVTGDRQNTSGNGTRVQMFSGGNDSTDAISRIDITCASNFNTGSIFSLYGVS